MHSHIAMTQSNRPPGGSSRACFPWLTRKVRTDRSNVSVHASRMSWNRHMKQITLWRCALDDLWFPQAKMTSRRRPNAKIRLLFESFCATAQELKKLERTHVRIRARAWPPPRRSQVSNCDRCAASCRLPPSSDLMSVSGTFLTFYRYRPRICWPTPNGAPSVGAPARKESSRLAAPSVHPRSNPEVYRCASWLI